MSWFVTAGFDDSVWLRAVNSANNRIITMTEGPFTITDKSLILWSPNGGEEFGALSTQTIQWEASGLSNLNIELSLDDGESWTPVASDVPSTQYSYQWLVPDTPSVNCRIRLSDTSYGYMNLQSDECFSIIPLEIVDPTVDFSADILTGDIPLAVQLTEDVNPGMGNIASRLWDFGDGNTSDQENPQHTYNVAGTYTVSLT
ncbi:MAG: PKD domain-containing protein, partial [Candidatus Cloacimonetes bacterium]|nr:PKD domain-containing protein [Candidatus Cloacimonadota bacterium]